MKSNAGAMLWVYEVLDTVSTERASMTVHVIWWCPCMVSEEQTETRAKSDDYYVSKVSRVFGHVATVQQFHWNTQRSVSGQLPNALALRLLPSDGSLEMRIASTHPTALLEIMYT